MKYIEKVLLKLEHCIKYGEYEHLETDKLELKNQPVNKSSKEYTSIKESICAFLNTNGGIIIVGIKENEKEKSYLFSSYNSNYEATFKMLESDSVCDIQNNPFNISDYLKFELRDFLDSKILVIYVDVLPADKKYAFVNQKAYERKITGDHIIPKNKILAQEEYKEEIKYAKEIRPVLNTTLENLSLDKLNEYIYILNKEVKIESIKNSLEDAQSFLMRKNFISKDFEPTVLGMLVCGEHLEDYLGNRCQVDCYVASTVQIAQNKRVFKDNILSLLENSFRFIYSNIQVGISATDSGTFAPEYPETLIRECINNSLAHRDYTIDRFISIEIVPQKHIEIRNPGGFKKSLIIEDLNDEIPLRRIVPNQKPVNPKLADVLKVYNKYEGRGIGMATLVNECLNDKIDIPYYKFKSEDDISLVISSGKLLDDSINNLLEIYSGFIQNLNAGEELTKSQKQIFAYLYKSEIENEKYHYTILLTPDNNHFDAISSLEKAGIIYKHQLSSSIQPIFLINREFLKRNFSAELKNLFAYTYQALNKDTKECLEVIYQISTYSKIKTFTASQIGNILYFQNNSKLKDVKHYDNFKRKIRAIFNSLEKSKMIIKTDKRYSLNREFQQESIFDS